ncbi:MAG: HD domain-containing protein [Nitrospirae bacterium]|nr:MAG: HD domain-containing protein [Nitrospirota bacterium]
MSEQIVDKIEYFRIDTFLPVKINAVSSIMRKGLKAHITKETGLKPVVINISAADISFKSYKKYAQDDILEIIFKIPTPIETTLCVYGEVRKVWKTKGNHYQVVAEFINMPEKISELIETYIFQWQRRVLFNTQISQKLGFYALQVSKLIFDTKLPFDIFIKDRGEIKYLFGDGLPFNSLTQEFFEEKNIGSVLIRHDDKPLFDNYLSRFRAKPKLFDRESLVSFRDYSFNKGYYHYIDRAVTVPHTEINFSLFTENNYVFETVVKASTEEPVTIAETVGKLEKGLFIRRFDLPLYRTYLNSLDMPPSKPEADRLKIIVLKEHIKIIMRELFTDPSNRENMAEAVGIAERIVECILRHPGSVYTLLSLDCNDFYLYVHSLNVAVMSAAVGLAMKLEYEAVLKLCVGALLHDIGLSVINDEIVNKQGKLNKLEYEVFKTHVTEGVKIIRGHYGISPESLSAVQDHHENMDGTGYPSGLSGNDISVFGKVIAIADAYDLMTPGSPYQKRHTPFEALSAIRKDLHYYDPEILKLFIKILTKVK